MVPLFGAAYVAPNKAPLVYTYYPKLIYLEKDSSISEVEFYRVAMVREKVLENEKCSRSVKSQGISFLVREM